MSDKNPLPFAKTQSRAMLLWVLAVLIGLLVIGAALGFSFAKLRDRKAAKVHQQ